MRSLVVYDSDYGNTAKVGETIHASLLGYSEASHKRIAEISEDDLKNVDLLVIGAPTQGGKPTEPAQQFISSLPAELLKHSRIAVYDTRMEEATQKLALRILMKTIGYAAPKMAQAIEKRGGTLITEPQGFIVLDKEGPLKKGELERADEWVRDFIDNKPYSPLAE